MQSLSNNIKRVITMRPFRPLLMLRLIEQYRVNIMITPPSQVAMLLQSPWLKLADLSSLRVHLVGGGFLDESLRKTMQDHLLYGALLVSYGMTEMAGLVSFTLPFQAASNSVGKIVPNTKLKVRCVKETALSKAVIKSAIIYRLSTKMETQWTRMKSVRFT